MKNILVIFFLFLCYNVVAQQRFPTGIPNQFSTGWFKQGYHQSDSGTIIANRDTNWLAKYSGTIVFKPSNKLFYWFDSTTLRWNQFGSTIDTTSLSNRINLKLNISDTAEMLSPYLRKADTTNKWVQDIYVRNDSLFKFKNGTETFLDTLNGGGGGSGTVTSVALSMPAAFSVTGSPITTSGTFNVSGAGTASQYVRGNMTLANTDTGMIPNFYLKVRGLLSGTSPITFNTTTGAIGINNANTSGTKGAATFNSSDFSDNGSGTISLSTLVASGSCTGCILNIDAKGRITGYSDGAGGATNNVNIGAGFRPVNALTQEMRTYFAGFGTRLDSVSNANGLTWSSDTTRSSGLPTYFYVDSLHNTIGVITADNGLTKTGDNIQLGGALIEPTNITSAAGANRIVYNGISAFGDGAQLEVTTSGSAGIAVSGETTDGRGVFGSATTGVGVYGTATGLGGYGVFGSSSLGNAYYARSDSGMLFEGALVPISNNTVITARSTSRASQSVGANGIGYSDDSYLQTTVASRPSHQFVYKLSNATDASYTSEFEFYQANAGSMGRKYLISGAGQWTWDGYPALTAQVDTGTYKPVAIDGSGNVVKMAGWAGAGGGGGGGTVTQVNTGYGLSGGPITTTGTVSADTTSSNGLATKYFVNRAGATYPFESTYGTFYENNKWTGGTMAAEFTNVNGTTIALNGNFPQSSSSTIAWDTYHRFLPLRPTLLPKWSFTVEFQIVSALGSNVGFGPALRSNNINGANFGYASYLACGTSTGTPHLAKQDGSSDQTNGSFTVAQGDVIRMTLAFNDSVMTLTSQNITTSSSIVTITKTFVAGSAPYVPNTGTLGFQNFSGTYEIRYIKFSSTATSSPTLAVAADSKGQIITTSFGGRFPSQINSNYPTVLQYSGSGDQLKDFIDKKEEVLQINPEQWWILLGSNDLRYGNSLATTMSRVREIKSWFTGTSTRVYWSVIPEDSTGGGIGLSDFNAALAAEVGGDYIDLWTDMSTSNILDAIYNSGDGVHPNQAGHNEVASLAIASGIITTQSPNRRSPFQKYGGGIAATGDSLATMYTLERAANIFPRWDDSLNMKPSFLYQDDTKMMISSNLTAATHFTGALLDVDGMISMGGPAASFVYRDRNNPSNFHAQYSQSNVFRFMYNGADHSYINASGMWKIGPDDGTTISSALQVRKSYTVTPQPTTGVGFALDTSAITINAASHSVVSYASFAAPTYSAPSSSTITNAPTLYIDRAPLAGTNTTITNPWALYIASGKTRLGTVDSTSAPVNMLYEDVNGEVKKAAVPSGGAQTWQQTLTTGSTLTTNNTVIGGNNSLTFTGMFNYRINANAFVLDKTTPVAPYTQGVLGTDNRFQIGYTPTATVYSKGIAIVIDTNNNVGLGGQMPTTAPRYATGVNTYIDNMMVEGGQYVGVTNITSDITLDLEKFYIRIDATSGNVTVTLPAASTAFGASVGVHYIFKRLDNSGNTVTIQRAGSDTIDGGTSITLTTQYEKKELQCSSTSTWDVR